jgi:hypothetical protein
MKERILLDDNESIWEYMGKNGDISELFELSGNKIRVILVSILILTAVRVLYGRNFVALVVVLTVVFYKLKHKRSIDFGNIFKNL